MTGLIILAAGESRRLGQPKQNLLFKGKTLLHCAIESGQLAQCNPIIVVLGANADMITPIAGTITLYNKDWREGMASSIRIGVEEIKKDLSVKQVVIMLCDQPFVDPKLLSTLVDKQVETGKPIVACAYNATIGVPVLFERTLFAELALLRGHEGAKKILNTHTNEVATIQFEQGSIDIDTFEDYEELRKLSD
jgi:molybdenum cofactor cytidylyltransferase